jgi:hypothetical protein
MSVNLQFVVTVETVPPEAVTGLIAALGGVMREESLTDDTVIDQTGKVPGRVQAYTTGPVIISGFGRWHPGFEARVKQVAGEHAPTATVKIDWSFPDED